MKIKHNICLKELEKFRYKYQENLIYPTYRKVFRTGSSNVIVEILVLNRTIFVNKNKDIKKSHLKYIAELERAKLIEK